MKIAVCGALLLLSVVLVCSIEDESNYFTPEFEYDSEVAPSGHRTKRSATLAFLVGVGAGGIAGPILYNRLYGWGRRPRRVTIYKGWQPQKSSGWQPAQSQGWQPAESQGWQPAQSQGWQPAQSTGGQPQQSTGWQSDSKW